MLFCWLLLRHVGTRLPPVRYYSPSLSLLLVERGGVLLQAILEIGAWLRGRGGDGAGPELTMIRPVRAELRGAEISAEM